MQRRLTKPALNAETLKSKAPGVPVCGTCPAMCPAGVSSCLAGESVITAQSTFPPAPQEVYSLVHRVVWPITVTEEPLLFDGRADVDKPFHMRLKENFWLSIENHCAALGVSKSEWVRVAMSKLLAEEQRWFLDRDGQL